MDIVGLEERTDIRAIGSLAEPLRIQLWNMDTFDLMGRLVSAYQLIQVIADLSFGNHAITSAWNDTWSLLP